MTVIETNMPQSAVVPKHVGSGLEDSPRFHGATLDVEPLQRWISDSRIVEPGALLIAPGSADQHVHFIRSGWACEFRTTKNGRQIIALLLPGDVSGLLVAGASKGASGLATMTRCEIASIPTSAVLAALRSQPKLAEALWTAAARAHTALAERLLNVGRRPALERMAHFLCETAYRQTPWPPEPDAWLALPLTQDVLADLLGMSAVHVNRTVQALQLDRLIEKRRGRFKVLDFQRLSELAGFDDGYLA